MRGYEKRDINGTESEGHKELNKAIRNAAKRRRVTFQLKEPPKEQPQKESRGAEEARVGRQAHPERRRHRRLSETATRLDRSYWSNDLDCCRLLGRLQPVDDQIEVGFLAAARVRA